MHHVAHYEPALAQTPAAYTSHSQGYAWAAFVDHTIAGAVHMRWIETQMPQPPNQQGYRFPADWAYLADKLDAEEC